MPANALQHVRFIIAVSSCKGGVGKSTLAAHLAQELARRGLSVGLVDTDIHGPSIPTLFNLQNAQIHVNAEKQLIPVEKNGLKIMSFGFLLGDAPAVLRGPIVSRYVQQVLQNTAWGELDYLFVDMPPGTGDVQLTITQHVRLSGAVIVTTPQTLSLLDVSRGILMFEKVNVPILGVIENMSYFVCDQCNKKHYIFGIDSAKTLKERFGVKTLAEIPILEQMIFNIDQPLANPFISAATDNIVAAVKEQSTTPQTPPTIQFDDKEIRLKWDIGEEITISNRDLRLSCRCALCANELTGKKIFTGKNLKPNIAAKSITPLGNYALGIEWNDHHTSGIYPYSSIKQLAYKKEHG
jgi:ATP-binding protein involved in chromosome partitioning